MTRLRIEPSPFRIRVQLGVHALGQGNVADSTGASLVFVEGRHPEYYFPQADIAWDRLVRGPEAGEVDELGPFRAIKQEGNAVGQLYLDGPVAGLVRLDFKAMDAWFEEEEQLFVHPRDPYVRVDVIESSRQVEVWVAGALVAASSRPRMVTETGLAPRWYLPRADVNLSALAVSETKSSCGYKGQAKWWNFVPEDGETVPNVAWAYERPVHPKLAGLICFFAEKEAVVTTVDGVKVTMPSFDPSMINASLYLVNQEV